MPPHPRPGLVLQPRDRVVLTEVARFRVLTSEHLSHLVFPGLSTRFVNRRLALLTAHGLLARHYLPDVAGGSVVRARRPVYSLTQLGAALVAPGLWPAVRFVPSAWAVIRHNLIATDCLVAAIAAGRASGVAVTLVPEPALRACLRSARTGGNRFPTAVLPDGALTVALPGEAPSAFCLEVVRADIKGGNRTFLTKMARYVALNRAGFFKTVFGLDRLRAVLIVTTGAERARSLTRLAGSLAYGRNLFWATSYEEKTDFAMTLRPETIFGPGWLDWTGASQTIRADGAAPTTHSSTPPHV